VRSKARADTRRKALPAILTSPIEADHWLEAETAGAMALQPRLPNDASRIVANGGKEDGTPPIAAVMCNLRSIAKGQQAIRARPRGGNAGNMSPRMSSFR
jgi:hypothetical protein